MMNMGIDVWSGAVKVERRLLQFCSRTISYGDFQTQLEAVAHQAPMQGGFYSSWTQRGGLGGRRAVLNKAHEC